MRITAALLGALLAITPAFAADKAGPAPLPPETVADAYAGATPSCYVQALGGSTIETVSAGVLPASLSASGWTLAVGAGCDVKFSRVVVGALARFEVPVDVDARLLDADYSWMVAVRGGYLVNAGLLAYGILGWQGQELGSPALALNTDGVVLGAGIEVMLSQNMSLNMEYMQAGLFRDQHIAGVNVEPVSHNARVGLTYRFNGIFQ